MKKLQFLLLDAGPIIKLFELRMWEAFIKAYDVLIARSVVEQIIYKGEGGVLDFIDYPFEEADRQGLLKIVDVESSKVKAFLDEFNLSERYAVDTGEDETIAYWYHQTNRPSVCSGDHAVYGILGYLRGGECGVSLEEALSGMGCSKSVELPYTKKFRERWTKKGQTDSVQGQDLV